jgi:hypothetical protein
MATGSVSGKMNMKTVRRITIGFMDYRGRI